MSTIHGAPFNLAACGALDSRTLADYAADFIRVKRAGNCSERTCGIYQWWLERLLAETGNDIASVDAAAVVRFLAKLRERGLSPSTVHQAYRTLKTFARWLVRTGALERDPTTEVRVKTPATLPDLHTAEEVMAVLRCCPNTFEGRRNRAMIIVLLDSGVRREELRRMRHQDLDLRTGSLRVRGKGAKDRVVFVSAPTLEAVQAYAAMGPGTRGTDYLFTDAAGRPLTARHLVQILHRLSRRAGLPPKRRLHPHALRHWAATSWIRAGMGLDQVRRLLGHSTLSTTLRYVSLVPEDLQRAHRDAAVIERLGVTSAGARAKHTGIRDGNSLTRSSSNRP